MRLHLWPIRTGTSGTYDRGRNVNQITKTVRLDKRGSTDSGHRKVREMTGYHAEDPEEALGNQGVSASRTVTLADSSCALHTIDFKK